MKKICLVLFLVFLTGSAFGGDKQVTKFRWLVSVDVKNVNIFKRAYFQYGDSLPIQADHWVCFFSVMSNSTTKPPHEALITTCGDLDGKSSTIMNIAQCYLDQKYCVNTLVLSPRKPIEIKVVGYR